MPVPRRLRRQNEGNEGAYMMFAFSQDWTNRSRDAECGLFGVDAMNSVAALACLPLTAAVTTTAAMATSATTRSR